MKNLKKIFSLFLVLALTFLIFGCNSQAVKTSVESSENLEVASEKEPAKHDLIVFAAASMTETLTQIKSLFEAENKNVNVVYNFDSSGTLKTQIEEGAVCDVFISASPKQMNQLDQGTETEKGLELIEHTTRFNLLENKVALAVPDGNKKNINSYDDLVKGLKDKSITFAMGNSDVPVGQYTQKILAYFELDENELASSGVITYGSNVKEVTTQISENTVDCGIIYGTDAYSAKLQVVDYATKEMCGQVIYPAACLKNSDYLEDGKLYLEFLKSNAAKAVFEEVGFSPLG